MAWGCEIVTLDLSLLTYRNRKGPDRGLFYFKVSIL